VPTLMKWDPMRDLRKLSWDFGQFFRGFMEPSAIPPDYCASPAVESFRHNGSLVVKVDLPGVNPKDVHLTAAQELLTIEGERKREEEIPETSLIRDELCYGSFRRSLAIPEGVKIEEIKAKYHDGILEITIPTEEHSLPKKIEVKVQES
jgi:HSP20 family protein